MDKVKIGIPRSIHYYYYGDLWISFFKYLNCDVIVSPKTNRDIMNCGIRLATDEMCLSMKNLLGHIDYLQDKCDYILIPRIDNYGISNQTCTNFLAIYDIVHNLFSTPILSYNIDVVHHQTEKQGMIQIGEQLGFSKKQSKIAYLEACNCVWKNKKLAIEKNIQKLKSIKSKVLLVGHPYNLYDEMIGNPIISFLKKMDVEIIYSNLFYPEITNQASKQLSNELYWKFNKENIGSIPFVQNQIDGIIFLSTFPCGPDSLVNELVMRKIKLPYLNLILDDMDGMVGFETRLESFIDIIQERKRKHV